MSCDCCNCICYPDVTGVASTSNIITITLRQGDDTDSMGRSITVTVTTDNDWTGYSARFQAGRIYKDIADVSSKTFNISLSSTETMRLPIGRIDGYIKFIDGNGKVTTDEKVIPFDILPMTVRNTGL
jgi:hypothetical protein